MPRFPPTIKFTPNASDGKLADAIRRAAKREGVTVSEWLRRAVHERLASKAAK